MSNFGHCLGPEGAVRKHKACPGRLQKWILVKPTGRGNHAPTVQMLDEYTECDCWCHKPGGKPPRLKRKK